MASVRKKNIPESYTALLKRVGVRRVNNVPMYLIGGAICIFVLIMALVAIDRSKQHRGSNDAKGLGGNSDVFANAIAGKPGVGFIPADDASTEVPASEEKSPTIIRLAPAPPAPDPLDEQQRLQIRQAKFNMLSEAVVARTSVAKLSARSSGSPPLAEGALSALTEGLKAITGRSDSSTSVGSTRSGISNMLSNGMLADAASGLSGAFSNLHADAAHDDSVHPVVDANATNEARSEASKNDRWRLDGQPEPPRSDFELRAGSVISATLISGINAELPGQIIGQIAQDVYDTATGEQLLLPQGARLVGTYASELLYGQSRILVAWQRIVFPDGKALDIGEMPGADAEGYAGFKDKVDRHYARIFGSALLMSAVTTGVTYSQNQGSRNGYAPPNAGQAMSEALGQQLGAATAKMIEKNLNVSPTLEIRPGYHFNVVVTKDIALTKPYQPFDY